MTLTPNSALGRALELDNQSLQIARLLISRLSKCLSQWCFLVMWGRSLKIVQQRNTQFEGPARAV